MINKQNTTRFTQGGAGGATRSDLGFGTDDLRTDGSRAGGGDDTGAPAIWSRVREGLRRRLGDARFDNWIARLELIAEVNGEVLVSAPGELERDRVRAAFGHLIQQEWTLADTRGRTVAIEARERIPADVLALAAPAVEAADAPATDVFAMNEAVPTLTARAGEQDESGQTLENFVVGDSNRVAFSLARRLANGQSVPANVVTLVGPHGVGKSHLQKGIFVALQNSRPEGHVLAMSAEEFTVAFVEGVKRKDTSDLRTLVRRARVVLLDDFQFICTKPGTLVEFFSHMRAIVANGGVVVLACDQAPSALDQLDERMRDEIQGGVIAHMDLPERSLRREIVRAKADAITATDEAFVFEDEWVDMLADRLPASGRALYGAVRNVYCGTILANKELSRAAVEKSIQLQVGGVNARAPKIDTIKDLTARAYGVSKHDLESSCRKRQFAQPRQYAMYLSRTLTTCSYPQIGRMFGDRDHTTVLFAYRKIARLVAGNEAMAEEMRQLQQRILSDPRNSR